MDGAFVAAVGGVGIHQTACNAAHAAPVAIHAGNRDVNIGDNAGDVGIVGVGHHAAGIGVGNAARGGQVHLAGHLQILNGGVAAAGAVHIAEQSLIRSRGSGGTIVDAHVLHGVIFAVKAALEGRAGGSAADGRPVIAGQINITRQRTVDGIAPAVDLRRKPSQLRCGTNLIHAVGQSGLRLGGAVPCAGSRGRQRNDLGQHTAGHISLVCAAQVEAAVDIVAAGAEHRIGVSAVGQVLILAVAVGGMDIACGIRQRHSGRGGGGIGNIQLQLEVIARSDLHIHIREAVQAEVHRDRIEVRAHAGIRHVIQGGKRVRRRVHGAVGITVGELNIGGAAGAKVHIRRDCQLQLGLIHLLILGDIGLIGRIADGIEQVVGSGVEDTTVLVDATVAALEGERHLIAGHDLRLLGIGGVGDRGGHFGHASQTVGHLVVSCHLDDNSTTGQPRIAEAQETCMVLAVGIRRQGGPAGETALHGGLVGGDNGVLNIGHTIVFAIACHREVQGGGGVVAQIEPVVVVIIPRRRARRTQAVGIIGDIGRCGTVFLAAEHKNTGTLRIRGRIEAAVGAMCVICRIYIQCFVIHGKDGRSVRFHIEPVVLGVAAVGFPQGGRTSQQMNLKFRLNHDICRVRVDDLPQAVRTDTLCPARVLVAAGGQEGLNLRFVTGLGYRAKIREAVRILIRGVSSIEGEFLRKTSGAALEPSGLGHISGAAADVLQAPGVVGIALADFVGQRSGSVSGCVCIATGAARLRLNDLCVEIIILEKQVEVRIGRNRHRQVDGLGKRQVLCNNRVSGGSRVVDRLSEDVVLGTGALGFHIGIPKGCVSGRVQHEGVVSIIAGSIGRTMLHIAAHAGH